MKRNRKNILTIMGAMLALLIVLTGCMMEGEPMARRGIIELDIPGTGNSTRSIKPGNMVATHYDISFNKIASASSELPAPFVKEASSSKFIWNGVPVGTYTVTVIGYQEKNGEYIKISEGTSDEFTVRGNVKTEVEVQLETLTDGENGKLEITYDWSGIEEVSGPLKDAMDQGTIKLYVTDTEGRLPETFANPIAMPVSTESTGVTFTFELPSSPEAYHLNLKLADKDGMIFDFVGPVDAVIRSGLTSVPVEGTADELVFTEAPAYAEAANIIRWAPDAETPATAVNVIIVPGQNVKEYRFNVYDVTEPESRTLVNPEPIVIQVEPGKAEFSISGLTHKHRYDIEIDAVYVDGRHSGFTAYPALQNIETLIPVESVTIDEDTVPATLTVGDGSFAVKADILPEDASDKSVEWTLSDPSVFSIGATGYENPTGNRATVEMTIAKPGKTTITVTSTAKSIKALSATSKEIVVHFASPALSAETVTEGNGVSGIRLSWTKGDSFQDSFDIYRNGELLTTVGDVTEYIDEAIKGGVSYSYEIVAKGTGYSADLASEKSAATAGISIGATDVNITVKNPVNGDTLTITNGGTSTVTASESVTLTAAGPESATYTWYLDGIVLEGTAATATITYSDIEKANAATSEKREHTVTVKTDYEATATTRIKSAAPSVSGYTIRTNAPSQRLPITNRESQDYVVDGWNQTIYLWTESAQGNGNPSYSVKSATRDGKPVEASTVATVNDWGMLTIRGTGDITLTATDGEETAEITFSFYKNTVPAGHIELLNIVNGEINRLMAEFSNHFGDWYPVSGQPTHTINSAISGSVYAATTWYSWKYVASMDGEMKFNSYVFSSPIGNITLDAEKVVLMVNTAGSAARNIAGFGAKEGSVITVTLPENQGKVEITYKGATPDEDPLTTPYDMKYVDAMGSFSLEGGNSIPRGTTHNNIANDSSVTKTFDWI